MKRYLFFLRAFNDTDNITPVIYFLLKSDKNIKVDIIFYSFDFDYRKDKNINFLLKQFPIQIQIIDTPKLLGVWSFIFHKGYKSFLYRKFLSRIYKSKSIDHIIADNQKYLNECEKFVSKVLNFEQSLPYTAVFDLNRKHLVGNLITSLKNKKIKVLTLPVSPWVTLNTMRVNYYNHRENNLIKQNHDYHVFDKVSFTDNLYLNELKKHFLDANKEIPFLDMVTTLGSIRFCPEWLAIRSQYIKGNIPEKSGKIKLLFLLTQPKNNVHWEEVLRVIELLSQFTEFEIIIKPHTRPHTFAKGIKYNRATQTYTMQGYSNITIDNGTDSSILTDWSDVIMFWGTSMALEGYMKSKLMLNLDFVHANFTVFKKFDAGWILSSRDELKFALEKILANGTVKPYDEGNVSLLLETMIYNNKSNVPKQYVDYLLLD